MVEVYQFRCPHSKISFFPSTSWINSPYRPYCNTCNFMLHILWFMRYSPYDMDHLIYNIDYRDRWTRTLVSADMLVHLLWNRGHRRRHEHHKILNRRHGRGHEKLPDRGHGRGHRHDFFKKKCGHGHDADKPWTRASTEIWLYNIAPSPVISNNGFIIWLSFFRDLACRRVPSRSKSLF